MKRYETLLRPWSVLALLAMFWCVAPALAADPPQWQPMLAMSFEGDAKNVGVIGLVVYRDPGCVFLLLEGKGVYCSPAGAQDFKRVSETWQEVCAHAEQKYDPQHRFELSDGGITESRDGGATWSPSISLPKDFVISSQTWVQYNATHDVLYLMKMSGDLYKLERGR